MLTGVGMKCLLLLLLCLITEESNQGVTILSYFCKVAQGYVTVAAMGGKHLWAHTPGRAYISR